MEIEIISFGQITEFIKNQKVDIAGIRDTDTFKQYLEDRFPALKGMKYKLALNKNIVQQNTEILNQATIAIMPPFSGG
ncbi:MoaD/ThiS family protein [Pedobacter riviphilus]|uniref:MoaD/ThiS family protein n=1 Tax=Pedobacter riviphilus TaxID=2766984 RepID=A0ABX6TCN0_9SPHI|nr:MULTISPECIES: MoaD/ThiS family protein [Pedobacter]NII83543.1 molybdopterin synthase sulfur carrier subunit [Pedobacter sp. SG908]NMN37405.1 molybdopterin synthase sulfur carrier subunit [Pedobacter sp. SG918]QNR82751.1 MoaD/ThiS family protein [Pedobacter riviphilus]